MRIVLYWKQSEQLFLTHTVLDGARTKTAYVLRLKVSIWGYHKNTAGIPDLTASNPTCWAALDYWNLAVWTGNCSSIGPINKRHLWHFVLRNSRAKITEPVPVRHDKANPLSCFLMLPDHHILMFCQAPFALYLIKVPFGAASRCSNPFLMRDYSFVAHQGTVFAPNLSNKDICEVSCVGERCNKNP